jgi:SecD/SecF fusion protein
VHHFSRWKTVGLWLIALAILFVAALALVPSHMPGFWPGWLPNVQIALGEGRQDKSRILLEVARQELADGRIEAVRDEIRAKLYGAGIAYVGLAASGRSVQVGIRDANDIERAKAALASLLLVAAPGADGSSPVSEIMLEEPEPGLLKYTLTEAGIDYRVGSAVVKSIEVIGRRIDELGISHPIIERQGADRILVEVTGSHDPERLQAVLSTAGRLALQWVDQSMPVEDAINGRPPAGSSILYSIEEPPVPYLVEDRVIVSGENIVDASAAADESTNEPVIRFRFDREGTRLFGEATQENVGRILAVILDSRVMMAPIIREPILGGWGQISGNLTTQSAEDAAMLLRAGSLPAALNVVESRFTPAEP